MWKYILNISITIILIVWAVIFSFDVFSNIKYNIFHSLFSPFQSEYEKSSYYKFKVPNEWALIKKNNDLNTFIGPVWNDINKVTSISVFQNFNEFENYVHMFYPETCKELDEVISIENSAIVKLVDEKKINIPAKIIFCKKDKNNESYISYTSVGAITNIIATPYSKKYKENYIELFKGIDYIILENEIPDWIKE